jgi:hypothetical protein
VPPVLEALLLQVPLLQLAENPDVLGDHRLPECVCASYTVDVIGYVERALQSHSTSCVREFNQGSHSGFKHMEAPAPLDYASFLDLVAAFQPRLRGYTEASWIVNDTFTVG